MRVYTLSEVCRRTGISASTLRYYERLGLLSPANITEHGVRYYSRPNLTVIAELQMLVILGHALSRRPTTGQLDAVSLQLCRHLEAMEQSISVTRAEITRLVHPGAGGMSDEDLLAMIRALTTGPTRWR